MSLGKRFLVSTTDYGRDTKTSNLFGLLHWQSDYPLGRIQMPVFHTIIHHTMEFYYYARTSQWCYGFLFPVFSYQFLTTPWMGMIYIHCKNLTGAPILDPKIFVLELTLQTRFRLQIASEIIALKKQFYYKKFRRICSELVQWFWRECPLFLPLFVRSFWTSFSLGTDPLLEFSFCGKHPLGCR